MINGKSEVISQDKMRERRGQYIHRSREVFTKSEMTEGGREVVHKLRKYSPKDTSR